MIESFQCPINGILSKQSLKKSGNVQYSETRSCWCHASLYWACAIVACQSAMAQWLSESLTKQNKLTGKLANHTVLRFGHPCSTIVFDQRLHPTTVRFLCQLFKAVNHAQRPCTCPKHLSVPFISQEAITVHMMIHQITPTPLDHTMASLHKPWQWRYLHQCHCQMFHVVILANSCNWKPEMVGGIHWSVRSVSRQSSSSHRHLVVKKRY